MNQHLAALQWVTTEIEQTVEELARSLLGFADNASDQTRLRLALTQAHQLHATLRVVGVPSAKQLAGELEAAVQAMLHGEIKPDENNLQLILAAAMQLPGYLKRVAAEGREFLLDVLGSINELRAVRGEPVIPEPSFAELVDIGELQQGISIDAEAASEDELQLLRKARQHFQVELLGLLKGEAAGEKLQRLQKVFALLAQRLRPSGHRYFWRAAAALCEAADGGGVQADSARDVLRELDAEFKASLALEGRLYTCAPSSVLYLRLLELIASSKPVSPLLAEIQRRHRLKPGAKTASVEAGVNDLGATAAVVDALSADLGQVLEQLETSDGEAFGIGRILREVEPDLERIANVLAGLGYSDEHGLLKKQIDVIASGLGGTEEAAEQLTEISAALLELDQKLAARVVDAGGDVSRAETRRHPLERARSALCREVQAGVELVKQSVSDYVNSGREVQVFAESVLRLHAMSGALRLAELVEAGAILAACRTYLDGVASGARGAPDLPEIESFAEALSSVEYFIERLTLDRSPAPLLLARAKEVLRALKIQQPAAPTRPSVEGVALAPPREQRGMQPEIPQQPVPEAELDAPALSPQAEGEPAVETEPALEFETTLALQPLEEPQEGLAAPEAEAVAEFEGGLELEPLAEAKLEPPPLSLEAEEEPAAGPEPALEFETTLELQPLAEPEAELSAPEAEAVPEFEGGLELEPLAEAQPEAEELELSPPVEAEIPVEPPAPQVEVAEEEEREPLDPEIAEIFVEEATEVLQTIDANFDEWRSQPGAGGPQTEIRRAFHTLKGSGRMVGAETIGELSWSVENLLNRVMDGTVAISGDVVEVVDRARALMPSLVEAFTAGRSGDLIAVERISAAAQALARGEAVRWEEAARGEEEPAAGPEPALEFETTLELQPLAEPEAELSAPEAEAVPEFEGGLELEPLAEAQLEAEPEPELEPPPLSLEAEEEPAAGPEPALEFETTLELQPLAEPEEELSAPEAEAVPEFEGGLELEPLTEAQLEAEPEPELELPVEPPALSLQAEEEPGAGPEPALEFETTLELQPLAEPEEELSVPETEAVPEFKGGLELEPLAEARLSEGADWEAAPALPDILAKEEPELPEIEALEASDVSSPADLPSSAGIEDWVPELEPEEIKAAEARDVVASVAPSAEEETGTSLAQVFASEAAEQLLLIRDFLASGRSTVDDPLIRALHTLKGSAGVTGFTAVAEAAAPLEALARDVGLRGRELQEQERELLAGFCSLLDLLAVAEGPEDQALAAAAAQIVTRCAALGTDAEREAARAADGRLGRFLQEALEKLFHATSLLDSWREGKDAKSSIRALAEDLQLVRQRAEQLELSAAIRLADPLLKLLGPAAEAESASTAVIDLVSETLEAFLDLLDRLAAGQLPEVPEELLGRLSTMADQQWAVAPAPAPVAGKTTQDLEDTAAIRARIGRELQQAEAELLDIFLEEAEDLMLAIDEAIDTWRHDRENREPFDALQRHLHTLKGGARMAGLKYLGDLSHNFETFLIGQSVHFGAFDEGFFVKVGDYHEQLLRTMDIVREPPGAVVPQPEAAAPAGEAAAFEEPQLSPAAEPVTPPPTPQPVSAGSEVAASAAVAPQAAATAASVAPPPAPDTTLREQVAAELAKAEADLLDIFLEEAEELAVAIDGAIDAWRGSPEDRAQSDDLKRHLHTLKGGARMAGLKSLGDISHEFETFLIDQAHRPAFDADFFRQVGDYHEQLLRVMDIVKERPEPGAAVATVAQDAVAATPAPSAAAPAVAAPTQPPPVAHAAQPAAPRPATAAQALAPQKAAAPDKPREREEVVRVSAQLLEELVNLAGETSISRGRIEEQVNELRALFSEMQTTIERMQSQVRRLDMATEAQIAFRRERIESEGDEGFDPLEMDRYSQQQQLSRSLVESTSDLLDIKRSLAEKTRDLETVLIQQSRVNTQLQEGLMRSRMVPFSSVLPRLRRIVRQVSTEVGKNVDLVVGNVTGDLDRGILERVVAPLEHMLRNAIDHGIESPELRRERGKPEIGRIEIEVGREGGDVLIAISDDGGGVNIEAVRKKAIERGLMNADSPLSDHEVVQFILHAGFSTAAKVTQISGRGVGMDVVTSEIRQMGGSLEIQTRSGEGSKFLIRLPFTVSVSRALLVATGSEMYALPLNTVEGVVRMRSEDLARYLHDAQARFEYAGNSYEVRYLQTLLFPGERGGTGGDDFDTVPVVLVRGGQHALAVVVDRLLGASEIVVKSLGQQFGAVPGLSGATVLGDGSVVIILDIPAILRADTGSVVQAATIPQAQRVAEEERPPLIMVVDDSVTVRKVTTRFLEREGMRVVTAKDGADAMVQLQDIVPDLMLLDIEMPHMDGFEVVSKLRLSDQLRHIPVIMITSRTGEKHRERALSLGANRYLGKPYQESILMENIRALLAEKQDK